MERALIAINKIAASATRKPELPVTCLLALVPDPVLRLRALRLATQGVQFRNPGIKELAFGLFSSGYIGAWASLRHDGARAGELFGGRCADALGPYRRHKVVVAARPDLANHRALRARTVAVAGFALGHALGDQLRGGVCVMRVLLRAWRYWRSPRRWHDGFDDRAAGFWSGWLPSGLGRALLELPVGYFVECKEDGHEDQPYA